jgi:biopolymer transport protein TolR
MTVSVASNGRSIQAELNLVPFIDFLSVLISFLLVSAVWTQLSRINLGEKGAANYPEERQPVVRPPEVLIKPDGFMLKTGVLDQIEGKGEALPEQLASLKRANPDQRMILVRAEAGVSYEKVILVVDLCLKLGFSDVDLASKE